MIKVQFTQDYRGSQTGPRMHEAKSVAEFNQSVADYLVNEAQVAKLVEEESTAKPKRSATKKAAEAKAEAEDKASK